MTGQEPPAGLSAGSRYVAMGSSFAAGPGIGPRVPGSPRAAGRSSANYAHLVARRLALDLEDVTFSGATTQDILRGTAAGRPAQVDAVTGATKLVTLTGGGNDVGWAPGILLSSLPRPLRVIPPVRRQLESFADPELTEQRFRTLAANLRQIAAEVRRRAPDSTLVFADYLTVLPPDAATPTGALPPDVAEWGRVVAGRLSEVTRAVAEQSGSLFVAASAASAGHHAWSAEPWTRHFHLTLCGGAPYHPTAAGMQAVADLVVRALRPPSWPGLVGPTATVRPPRRARDAAAAARVRAEAERLTGVALTAGAASWRIRACGRGQRTPAAGQSWAARMICSYERYPAAEPAEVTEFGG